MVRWAPAQSALLRWDSSCLPEPSADGMYGAKTAAVHSFAARVVICIQVYWESAVPLFVFLLLAELADGPFARSSTHHRSTGGVCSRNQDSTVAREDADAAMHMAV